MSPTISMAPIHFLEEMKRSGLVLQMEEEWARRLAEAPEWRYAFVTLAQYGQRIGVSASHTVPSSELVRTMQKFGFSDVLVQKGVSALS